MVLNVGLISAMVLFKRNPKSLTRLERIAKQQKQKPSQKLTLHQVPLKGICSVVFILAFTGLLFHFEGQFRKQVIQQASSIISNRQDNAYPTFKGDSSFQLSPQTTKIVKNDQQVLARLSADFTWPRQQENNKLNSSGPMKQAYAKIKELNRTIRWIAFALAAAVIIILFGMELTLVEADKSRKSITRRTYSLGRIQYSTYSVVQGCYLEISETGDSRFTNNNFHYEVKLISPKSQTDEQQQATCQSILKRSSIYQSRKAVILISSVLSMPPPNLKISKIRQNASTKSKPNSKRNKAPSI